MSKITIDANHNPENAIFWASFATESGQQKKHCPTVTLYENSEGEFFAAEGSRRVAPTTAELVIDPREWLQECIDRLKNDIPEDPSRSA